MKHNITVVFALLSCVIATALTLIDLLTTPKILADAKEYFNTLQTKDVHYIPFVTAQDPPPVTARKKWTHYFWGSLCFFLQLPFTPLLVFC